MTSTRSLDRIRVGISTCPFGEKVRFDGGHQLDQYAVGVLGRYVDWTPSLRVRLVNAAPVRVDGTFVLYWMVAQRRSSTTNTRWTAGIRTPTAASSGCSAAAIGPGGRSARSSAPSAT
jgi:hypothetical protein